MATVAAPAGATTLETPGVLMANTRNTPITASEVPMFRLMLAELAEIFARTARLAALMRRAAPMASVEVPQREERRPTEDFRKGQSRRLAGCKVCFGSLRTTHRPLSSPLSRSACVVFCVPFGTYCLSRLEILSDLDGAFDLRFRVCNVLISPTFRELKFGILIIFSLI